MFTLLCLMGIKYGLRVKKEGNWEGSSELYSRARMVGFLRDKLKLHVINGKYLNHVHCTSSCFIFIYIMLLNYKFLDLKIWNDLKIKIKNCYS